MAHQTLAVAVHLLVLTSVASCSRPIAHGDAALAGASVAIVSPPAPEGDFEGREAFELLDTLNAVSSAASDTHDALHGAVPPVVDPLTKFRQHVKAAKDQVVQSIAPVVPQPVKDVVDTVDNVKHAVSDVKNDMKGMVYNAVDKILFSAAAGRQKETGSMAALLVAASMTGALFL